MRKLKFNRGTRGRNRCKEKPCVRSRKMWGGAVAPRTTLGNSETGGYKGGRGIRGRRKPSVNNQKYRTVQGNATSDTCGKGVRSGVDETKGAGGKDPEMGRRRTILGDENSKPWRGAHKDNTNPTRGGGGGKGRAN